MAEIGAPTSCLNIWQAISHNTDAWGEMQMK
jgi:hypothetical protein